MLISIVDKVKSENRLTTRKTNKKYSRISLYNDLYHRLGKDLEMQSLHDLDVNLNKYNKRLMVSTTFMKGPVELIIQEIYASGFPYARVGAKK